MKDPRLEQPLCLKISHRTYTVPLRKTFAFTGIMKEKFSGTEILIFTITKLPQCFKIIQLALNEPLFPFQIFSKCLTKKF